MVKLGIRKNKSEPVHAYKHLLIKERNLLLCTIFTGVNMKMALNQIVVNQL